MQLILKSFDGEVVVQVDRGGKISDVKAALLSSQPELRSMADLIIFVNHARLLGETTTIARAGLDDGEVVAYGVAVARPYSGPTEAPPVSMDVDDDMPSPFLHRPDVTDIEPDEELPPRWGGLRSPIEEGDWLGGGWRRAAAPRDPPNMDELVARVAEMGFGEEAARQALRIRSYDVGRAVDFLLQ